MTERNQQELDQFRGYSVEPTPAVSPGRDFGRIARLLIIGGVVLLLGWVAIKTFRIYQAAQGLLSLQSEAEMLLQDGLQGLDPETTTELVREARADIVVLNRELAFVQPLGPLLGALPRIGPLVEASPHLLTMAEAGSEAAELAVDGLAPALSIIQQDGFGTEQVGELLPIIREAAPDLVSAAAALDRIEAARSALDSQVDVAELPWRLQQVLGLADELLPAGRAGLELAPQLPLLLGANGPRRYLIMAQNEDELRPTGGFLTGAGVVTVENGRILDLSLRDANGVDNWRDKPYDFPPQPYYDFMLAEMFLFRDANFWADFPTSAQRAMDLYAYGQDESALSGAIAIDQEFLRLLVDATGPIAVDGGQAIDGSNLIATLQQARDLPEGEAVGNWVADRKAFLSGFAGAIRSKLESDFSSVDPVKLARNMATALDERHLQIYMSDQAAADALAEAGWDGRLPVAPPGDFWMVVDTNMGFNKVNLYIERAFDYTIDLGNPQVALARLNTTYTHSGAPTGEPCYQGVEAEFEEGASYLALADKCYWNYVRAYAPTGSTLVDSSRHVVPGETLFSEQTWDSTARIEEDPTGLAVFANFMLLPQGETANFSVSYTLPEGIIQLQSDGSSLYELRIQKQAGTRPEPLRLAILLPEGAELIETIPAPALQTGNRLEFDTVLETNMVFRIRFR